MSKGREGITWTIPGPKLKTEEPKLSDAETFRKAKETLDAVKAEEEAKKFDMNKVDWARVGTAAGGAWLSHWLASSLFGDDDEDDNRSFWSKALSKIIPLGAAGIGAYGGWKIPDFVKLSSSAEERARALATVKDSVQAAASQVRNDVTNQQNKNLQERKDKILDIGENVVGGITGAGLTIDGARRWLNALGDARVMNEWALADKGVSEAQKALADSVQKAKAKGAKRFEKTRIDTQSDVRGNESNEVGKHGKARRRATVATDQARDIAKAKQRSAGRVASSEVEAAKAIGTADLEAAQRRLANAEAAVKLRGSPSKTGGRPKMTATEGRGVVRSGEPKAPWKPGPWGKVEAGVGVPLLGWNLYKGIVNNDKLDKINADIDETNAGYKDWEADMDSAVPGWRKYVNKPFTPPQR